MTSRKTVVPLAAYSDSTNPQSPWVLSYFAQRRIAGWTGICLPVVVAIITTATDCNVHHLHLPDSISESYYTLARNYFVGSLCTVGIFLIAAVGYDEDRLLSFFAGAMSFVVGFSPCKGVDVPCLPILKHTGMLHTPAAVLLFLDLAWICMFRFTRTQCQKTASQSPATITPEKRTRNSIYRACGGIMLFAMAVEAVAAFAHWKSPEGLGHLTYTVEAICLIAFGFAWLVKGEQYFADASHPNS